MNPPTGLPSSFKDPEAVLSIFFNTALKSRQMKFIAVFGALAYFLFVKGMDQFFSMSIHTEVRKRITSPDGKFDALLLSVAIQATTYYDDGFGIVMAGEEPGEDAYVFHSEEGDTSKMFMRWKGSSLILTPPPHARRIQQQGQITIDGTIIPIKYVNAK